MKKITLRLLTNKDEKEFFRAFSDSWEENFTFVHYWESLAGQNFERYVEIAPGFTDGKLLPEGHVPAILLFAFNSDGEIVGRTSIRFDLTDSLLQEGGHIGYGVCPRFRRQGYATAILAESLNFIKEKLPHLQKALVTCDEGNLGSQKTIERNNGILDNIVDIGGSFKKMRYWIGL